MTPSDESDNPNRSVTTTTKQRETGPVPPGRLAGAGFELGCFALLLGAMGHGADQWLGFEDPIFAITGFLLGFSAGLYRLIKLASG